MLEEIELVKCDRKNTKVRKLLFLNFFLMLRKRVVFSLRSRYIEKRKKTRETSNHKFDQKLERKIKKSI